MKRDLSFFLRMRRLGKGHKTIPDEKVRSILRRLENEETVINIAKKEKVGRTTVYSIQSGELRSDVTLEEE